MWWAKLLPGPKKQASTEKIALKQKERDFFLSVNHHQSMSLNDTYMTDTCVFFFWSFFDDRCYERNWCLGPICGDDLANLWEIEFSPSSPDSETTLASLPTTPAVDPNPTVKPTPCPLFAGIQKNNNSNPLCDFVNFDENVLSGINFQTPKREALGSSFQCSNAHLFRDSKC